METVLVNPSKSRKVKKPAAVQSNPRRKRKVTAPKVSRRASGKPRRNPSIGIGDAVYGVVGGLLPRAAMKMIGGAELEADGKLKTAHLLTAAIMAWKSEDVAGVIGASGTEKAIVQGGILGGLSPYAEPYLPADVRKHLLRLPPPPPPEALAPAGTEGLGSVQGQRYRGLAGDGVWVVGADGRLYWHASLPPQVEGVGQVPSGSERVTVPDNARVGDVVRTPDGRRFVIRQGAAGQYLQRINGAGRGVGSVASEGVMSQRYFEASE